MHLTGIFNGAHTRERKSMSIKKAVVRQVHGITLAAKADTNHWVMMDGRDSVKLTHSFVIQPSSRMTGDLHSPLVSP